MADDRLEQAAKRFLRVSSESMRIEELTELQRWIASDPRHARAYRKVSATWDAVGTLASTSKVVVGRDGRLEDSYETGRSGSSARPSFTPGQWARRIGTVRSWAIAASVAMALAIGLWSYVSHRVQVYSTGFGERRTLTLQDGSVVTLDARTVVRVKYTRRERWVELERGQAQFTVAKNPSWPFQVHARDQVIVALGTQFDVDLVSGGVFVTMIEGRVAVGGIKSLPLSVQADGITLGASLPGRGPLVASAPTSAGSGQGRGAGSAPRGTVAPGSTEVPSAERAGSGIVELTAGESLRIPTGGRAILVTNIDPRHASAWQYGKIYFDDERLGSAAERLNRYSRRQIQVDPSIANIRISGIFNTGDTDSFVQAITEYFPIRVDRENESEVHLTARE
jgi:transmembrane sensor